MQNPFCHKQSFRYQIKVSAKRKDLLEAIIREVRLWIQKYLKE